MNVTAGAVKNAKARNRAKIDSSLVLSFSYSLNLIILMPFSVEWIPTLSIQATLLEPLMSIIATH